MLDRKTTMSTGFSYGNSVRVVEVVKQVSNSTNDEGRLSLMSVSERKNANIQLLIRKGASAYIVDGLVRQSVDRYSEQFKDFSLQGGDRQIKYLEDRLNQMSLRMGESWKTTLARGVNEYFKVGNSYLTKVRGDAKRAVRPLYSNKPHAIVGIRLVSADLIQPKIDSRGNVLGWKPIGLGVFNTDSLTVDSSKPLPRNRALVELPEPSEEEERRRLILPGLDFCHLAYKKPADCALGVGMTLSGLEDVSLLRTIESNTATMLKKYSMPLLHHKVTRKAGPGGNLQQELDRATLMHQRSAPDGVIVTGENHEITSIGAESMALRVEGYLDFFSSRACVGIGASSDLLGLRPSTLSTAQAANERMMSKVRYCQAEIARELEFFLLWEILYEGGFDPFTKEEDRVYLTFKDIDEDRTIKLQTHAADLFTKNLVDHDNALKIGGFDGAQKEPQMHFTKYQKPLKADKPPAKKKPAKKKSREAFSSEIDPLKPENAAEAVDCLVLLARLYNYDEQTLLKHADSFAALVEDWPAAVEFLYQTLFGEP